MAQEDLLQRRLRSADPFGGYLSRGAVISCSGEGRRTVRHQFMSDQRGDQADALIPFRRKGPFVPDGLQYAPAAEMLDCPLGVPHRPGAYQRRGASPVDDGDVDPSAGQLDRRRQTDGPAADDQHVHFRRWRGDRKMHCVDVTPTRYRQLRHRSGVHELGLAGVGVCGDRQPEVAPKGVRLVLGAEDAA